MYKKVGLLIFISLILFVSRFGYSSSVVPVDLEKMSVKAGYIFHGVCTDVKTVEDENGFIATEVTYDVIRSVKGNENDKITFKVFGFATGEGKDTGTTLVGLAPFYYGREDVLFLYKESPWGFTSPVGLWQGSYPVIRDGADVSISRKSEAYNSTIAAKGFKAASSRNRVSEIVTPDNLLDEVENILQ